MKKMLSWWHLKWVNILTVHGEGVEGAPLAILQIMMDLELSSVFFFFEDELSSVIKIKWLLKLKQHLC